MNHREILRNRWHSICRKFNLDGNSVWNEILSNYTTPGRAYHNLQHVQDCLEHLDEFAHLSENPTAVEMAIWLHDVIYDTRSYKNEEDSSHFAKALLGDSPFSETVSTLIIATKHDFLPSSQDAMLICDIDLSILGRKPERYQAYSEAIRNEYSWVSDSDFRTGRITVLKSFLQRSRIFGIDEFYIRYEAQSRSNIQKEFDRLVNGEF